MKKTFALLLACALLLGLAACGEKKQPQQEPFFYDEATGFVIQKLVGSYQELASDDQYIVSPDSMELGIDMGLYAGVIDVQNRQTGAWQEMLTLLYTTDAQMTEGDVKDLYNYLSEDDGAWDALTKEAVAIADGHTVYVVYNNTDNVFDGSLAQQEPELYARLRKDLADQVQQIAIREPVETNVGAMQFTTTDYNGNTVDNSIFSQAKLTMVNYWGTTCGPCIGEMQELQELNDEIGDFQIVTVAVDLSDLTDTDTLEDAKQIMDTQGVTLPVLVYNQALDSIFRPSATPTSILVDSTGTQVGSVMVGAVGKDSYRTWIQSALDSLG